MKTILLKIVDYFDLYQIFNRFTKNTATVFMLHRISNEREDCINGFSTEILREYFDYLKKNKYKVIRLSSYINALINNEKMKKTVVFTVDDGYRDFYLNAYEIFKQYNYPASIFITSDFIEGDLVFWWDKVEYVINNTMKQEICLKKLNVINMRIDTALEKARAIGIIVERLKEIKNEDKLELIKVFINEMEVDISGRKGNGYDPLEWDDIYEMKENRIEFFPHTKTHPIMSKIPLKKKIEELSISKNILEKRLGESGNIFCYPNGGIKDFDEETISVLKSLDYVAAVTGLPGLDYTNRKVDMYRIHRFGLSSNMTLFKQHICGLESFKRKMLGTLLKKYR